MSRYHINEHSQYLYTPVQRRVEKGLQRQLFLTWAFISQEGLLDEAVEFLQDHEDTPLPFP